jgi:hypothetical protein
MAGNLVANVATRCRTRPGDLLAATLTARSTDARICRPVMPGPVKPGGVLWVVQIAGQLVNGDQLAGCAARDKADSSTPARHRCQASLLAAAGATVVDADRQPKEVT